MKRKSIVALAAAIVAVTASYAAAGTGIKGSKHDLSFASPAANQTDQICVFCHTPHNSVQPVPLWNRNASGTAAGNFKLYTSSQTLNMGQDSKNGFHADSISLFCMSCHDGSALGGTMVGSEPVGVSNDALKPNYGTQLATTAITNSAKLGTDLTKSHPVNFKYDSTQDSAVVANGSLRFPLYKSNGQSDYLECSSCHAVHGKVNPLDTSNNYPRLLRSTMKGSALCLGCHVK